MARRRASMREGPLAELFKATEAAQKQAGQQGDAPTEPEAPVQQSIEDTVVEPPPAAPTEPEVDERTVEHVPSWEEEEAAVQPPCAAQPKRGEPLEECLPSWTSAGYKEPLQCAS